MTLASPNSRVDYIGNGATDTYPYTFKIFSATDLLVTTRDTSDVETTMVYLADYSVTGAGSAGGGNVILTAGNLASGYAISIRRVRPVTQGTDIRNQGAFYPETHENAFDHQVMLVQQQQEELARTLKLPETEAGSAVGTTIPAATSRAGKLLGFDSSGNPTALTTIPTSSVAISAFGESLIDDANAETARATLGFTGIGSTVGTDNIDDDAVTADKIADDAVGTAQIQDDAVTTDKISDGAVTLGKLGSDVLSVVGLNDGWFVVANENGWAYEGTAGYMRYGSAVLTDIRCGDRIKITQDGITKYFYVGNVSSGASTLIYVYAGTRHTLTSSGITNVRFSRISRPSGFPPKFPFTAIPVSSIGGFSSHTETCYATIDNSGIVTANIDITGTSSGTALTIELPFFAGASRPLRIGYGKDNGTALTGPPMIKLTGGGQILVYKDGASAGWTASGLKEISGTVVYPIREDFRL